MPGMLGPISVPSRITSVYWTRATPSPFRHPPPGIPPEPLLLRGRALLEPSPLAGAPAGGGDDYHPPLPAATPWTAEAQRRTKFAIRRSPTAWLFSGWNWTPST